ncbi:MAG: STAS domain-containing protein [Terracidiphilus sp.]|jgi:anti-anti-sigma factor
MKNARFEPIRNVVIGATELVRGQDQKFLETMKPLVRCQSVRLDLNAVQRIDAAGLAALITLFCAAREAGHDFKISNPSPRVAEILSIVGLNRILNPQAAAFPGSGAQLAETAA